MHSRMYVYMYMYMYIHTEDMPAYIYIKFPRQTTRAPISRLKIELCVCMHFSCMCIVKTSTFPCRGSYTDSSESTTCISVSLIA